MRKDHSTLSKLPTLLVVCPSSVARLLLLFPMPPAGPTFPSLLNGFAHGLFLLSVVNNLKAKDFINFCLLKAGKAKIDVEFDELLDFML